VVEKFHKAELIVTNLVNIFEKILNIEDELLKLKSCYGDVMYFEPFDIDNLKENTLFSIFNFVENEKYNRLRKTAAIYDIYSESEVKEIMDKYRAEEHETSTQLKYKHFEPPEFIQVNFKILNAIYAIFLRNNSYAEVFGRLRDYKRLMKSPNTLMEFVWRFRFVNDSVQAICPTNEFIRRAAQYFKESKDKVKDVLVYDRYNKSIFPLFVKFQTKELGNMVFISHRFSFLIHTFLHSILTEDLFNAETEKRSLQFEKQEVKTEFEKNKFLYFPDIVDRKDATFQIDGLAIKDRTCYVVECKGWRLNKFLDEKRNRDQIIRDLKGIVIGEKYTTKNQLTITKKIPSLVKKIEFVKNNLHKFISHNTQVTIEGLIVTIRYLPLSKYEGVRFISIEEIRELL
jgi:Nuclease-related domain